MPSRLKTIVALMRNPRVSKVPRFLVVGAILYLLWPWDIVPDVAPVVGWLDDITFIIGALSLLRRAAPGTGTETAQDPIIDVTPESKPDEPRR